VVPSAAGEFRRYAASRAFKSYCLKARLCLSVDVKCEVLRHMVATVACRGGMAVSDAPEDFAGTREDR
jgi:hypothetical protein